MDALTEKVVRLRNALASRFVGRDLEVDAVLASLLSGEPCILVGPPGTGKTLLIDSLAGMVKARFFRYLLTRFTEPDEILGPLDIKALREGRYERVTAGRLLEAEVAFLDEVFKASSSIRNVLLDIILNRRYLNGGRYVVLPLLTLYAASNEVGSDEEDQAFYDRMTIRRFLRSVSVDMWSELIDKGVVMEASPASSGALMSTDDVRRAQSVVKEVMLRQYGRVKGKYLEALARLKERGIELSDRRKVKVLRVAAAYSLMYSGASLSTDDVADALIVCAPMSEDDVGKVEEAVAAARLYTYQSEMLKIKTLVAELGNALASMRNAASGKAFNAALSNALSVYGRLRNELSRAPRNMRVARQLKELAPILRRAREEIDRVMRERGRG